MTTITLVFYSSDDAELAYIEQFEEQDSDNTATLDYKAATITIVCSGDNVPIEPPTGLLAIIL